MTMQRYFLEVFYKGGNYSGFQIQENANSIQAEVEKAFHILHRKPVPLTGSSRTDTGVHALQNFFHFDFDEAVHPQLVYKMNAILPDDIGIKNIFRVDAHQHCRFDATSREYRYYIYKEKNPFLRDRAYFFPYTLNLSSMKEAAGLLTNYRDFSSFSKRNSQVKTHDCILEVSEWLVENGNLVYRVKANRFLRGMVRGLTGTMLQVGRGKSSLEDFKKIIESRDCTKANFSVPPQGLFLVKVEYPYGFRV